MKIKEELKLIREYNQETGGCTMPLGLIVFYISFVVGAIIVSFFI